MIQDAYLCPDHVLPVSHLPSDIDPAMLSALSSADLRGMEREAKDKVCFPPQKKKRVHARFIPWAVWEARGFKVGGVSSGRGVPKRIW